MIAKTWCTMMKTLLFVVLVFQWTAFGQLNKAATGDIEIKLFFVNPNLPNGNDCDTGEFVVRKIPRTSQVADAALRQLFAGPSQAEKEKGMQGISKLGGYYRRVTIKNGTAVINFRSGAEKFLYVTGPICTQNGVLTPISKTLKQFPSIKVVDYAIDGKLIKGWDA